jgi:hypothetical protein
MLPLAPKYQVVLVQLQGVDPRYFGNSAHLLPVQFPAGESAELRMGHINVTGEVMLLNPRLAKARQVALPVARSVGAVFQLRPWKRGCAINHGQVKVNRSQGLREGSSFRAGPQQNRPQLFLQGQRRRLLRTMQGLCLPSLPSSALPPQTSGPSR